MTERPRGFGYGLLLGLALAAFFATAAQAQYGGGQYGGQNGGMGRRGQGPSANLEPIPNKSASPRSIDPEAYDAIDLYSRLCVSTRGDRARATGIVGNDDSAIEKMDPPLLRGLENGRSDGIGWIIRMPLGDKVLLEFPPDGTCIVRAPHVNQGQMEAAFRNLLDQYAASGQFLVKRLADETKTLDSPVVKQADAPKIKDEQSGPDRNKLRFHVIAYKMTLPDSGKSAQLVLATTDSMETSIQASMSFVIPTDGDASPAH